ncbi:hypothetical protein N7493_000844 [Penicillium malachiteum]|uniref:Uncharacterized protein n=1 Tax=Penicillium malachiteum TaxID=1324776 RepID=A0AAD6HXY8_9EURO|nr:hypothetical protein N7493_000844 [Penicillium malachiteum]
MPKWNWFTGHLLVLQEYFDRLPTDANIQLAIQTLALENHGDTKIFLMDTWPVYPPFYMVFDPQTAYQVSNKFNLPKLPLHLKFMHPITGGPSLHGMNHEEWRYWRAIFNPGFSGGSMMDLVPAVVDSVQVFCDILQENVGSKDPVQLSGLTTRMTMEIILKVSLDMDSNNQRVEHPISTSLRKILAWHSFWDPFRQRKNQKQAQRGKSIIALALEAYLADPKSGESKNVGETSVLDEHFAKYASYQIRLFLFAGNDTTSSTISYVYHLLFKHPDILRQVREEPDRVFGSDPSAAGQRIKSDPTLLNDCPLTLAVIKETLRLYPPASTSRGGLAGKQATLTDPNGNLYPIDYVGANILHPACHLNPRVWPRAKEFLPERWLGEAGHELYPVPGAWRPFEHGPHNCIGQTLVYNEIRVVLAMSLRSFNISPAYDEWDALNLQKEGLVGRLTRQFRKPVPNTLNGERAYQTELAGYPKDDYPCRIELCN